MEIPLTKGIGLLVVLLIDRKKIERRSLNTGRTKESCCFLPQENYSTDYLTYHPGAQGHVREQGRDREGENVTICNMCIVLLLLGQEIA